jgi:hypothetical protein
MFDRHTYYVLSSEPPRRPRSDLWTIIQAAATIIGTAVAIVALLVALGVIDLAKDDSHAAPPRRPAECASPPIGTTVSDAANVVVPISLNEPALGIRQSRSAASWSWATSAERGGRRLPATIPLRSVGGGPRTRRGLRRVFDDA